jgi:GH18 family chitinase
MHLTISPRLVKLSLITVLALFLSLPSHAKKVVATYYAADGNTATIDNLPAKQLTHVLYAFLAVCGNNQGAPLVTQQAIKKSCKGKAPFTAVMFNEEQAKDELSHFKQLKKKHPHLILLPSFGGWTLSNPFHDIAKSSAARQHFVKTAVSLIAKHDVFDGIDIDWEFPGGGGNTHPVLEGIAANQEKITFRLMMKEFRTALNTLSLQTNRQYQLTAAVSGSAEKTKAINWQKTIPHMDYVFAMTYDFVIGDGQAGHHTNLFSPDDKTHSTAGMINNLLNAGIPESKLVIGVAFYGRGWLQSGWQKSHFNGVNRASSIGSFTYKQLLEMPLDGYQYGYDENAQAAYLYHPEKDAFISFDDKRSIAAKANWVKSKGLAGLFSWQIRQDNGDLVSEMY